MVNMVVNIDTRTHDLYLEVVNNKTHAERINYLVKEFSKDSDMVAVAMVAFYVGGEYPDKTRYVCAFTAQQLFYHYMEG